MLTTTKTRLLFGSALLLFSLSGAGAFVALARLRDAERWVAHTRDVQLALAHVNTLTARIGRTRTTYVDSGDPAALQEHHTVIAQLPQTFATLRALTTDNPNQLRSCARLEELSRQRIDLMEKSIALHQSGESTLQAQTNITQSTVALAGQIDDILQSMANEEQGLLDQRIGRRKNREQLAAGLLLLTFLIAGALFVIVHRLLTSELKARLLAQHSLQRLSARVLTIRDEERRRFSRELHDSMGQHLASAKMHLDLLGQSMPGNAALHETSDLLDQALSETRTLSYLLHPPLLDDAGLESAAREYVDGFSRRSGIPVALHLPPTLERLGEPLELTLFRVMQEGLTNIHRHSGCTQATINLAVSPTQVALSIRDNGRGMSPEVLEGFRNDGTHLGVGLAGMRERVREFGGRLDLHSDGGGTLLSVILPRPRKEAARRPATQPGASRDA